VAKAITFIISSLSARLKSRPDTKPAVAGVFPFPVKPVPFTKRVFPQPAAPKAYPDYTIFRGLEWETRQPSPGCGRRSRFGKSCFLGKASCLFGRLQQLIHETLGH
jgi:hypothetical protein